jgi:CheY-like chemotaxis protein
MLLITLPDLSAITSIQQLVQTTCEWLGQLAITEGVLYWQRGNNNTYSLQYLHSHADKESWDLSQFVSVLTQQKEPYMAYHHFLQTAFTAHSYKVSFANQDYGYLLALSRDDNFENPLSSVLFATLAQVMAAYCRQIDTTKRSTVHSYRPLAEENALSPIGQFKVLLVEDTLAHQIITSKFLKNMGVYVEIAGNSAEAIQKVQQNTFDIVLMDLQLPDKDGFATTVQLRELGYQMPIVALTAENGADIQQQALANGLNGVLSKPIQLTELKPTIEKLRDMKPITSTVHQPDYTFLMEAANGNAAFFENMLKITITEFEQFENSFSAAFKKQDTTVLRQLRHKILPHLTSYRLYRIQSDLEQLILLAEKEEWKQGENLLSEVRKGLQQAQQHFKGQLK